eukprot:5897748-Alexandrium_andersonii.AAC.1
MVIMRVLACQPCARPCCQLFGTPHHLIWRGICIQQKSKYAFTVLGDCMLELQGRNRRGTCSAGNPFNALG